MPGRPLSILRRVGLPVCILALFGVACAQRPAKVATLVPPPPRVVGPTGSVYIEIREPRGPLPGALVLVLGQRIGGITDESGRSLIADVPVGMARVQVRLIGYVPAQDSVLVQEGRVDTLRFRMEIERRPEPPAPPPIEAIIDTLHGPGRLIVRLRPSPRADVRVTLRRDGRVVRRDDLMWDHPDQEEEAEFTDLPYGTYQVEAKGVRIRRLEYLQYHYWNGSATKTFVLVPQKHGKPQRVSVSLRWKFGGLGQFVM